VLQNLVGELIIAENMFRHNPMLLEIDDENLTKARAQLIRVTRELQDIATSVRMIPVAATFQKMNRIVRDVSTRQGKKVQIILEGEYTEVDKTVIEKLSDPLVHLVRNSVDHGVETIDERLIAGKDPIAKVTLSAKHQSGEIWITVKDDGKGLHREKILDRARSRGLLQGEGTKLKDSDVWQYIFEPGFSTAAAVTDISGRGVGMDVVRKNVEALRGRIDVESVTGSGSEFIMRIPLTLAIIEGMLARVGEQKYTIPMLSVKESIRATHEMIREMPSGSQMLSLRGTLIPILRIDEFHAVQRADGPFDLEDGILVVVEDGNDLVGLFVDELIGQFQTVIKPLPGLLGRPKGLSGMCLLANGDISLILDIKAIAGGSGDLPTVDDPEELEQPAA
jgi:two-component system chemotaxis sensor kinase CheA